VLLLFAPPGSAKSTYVSVLLPSWYLAANPSLYVPTSTPWYAEFKSELLGFPASKHDDQVDAHRRCVLFGVAQEPVRRRH
jgi:phage terminase large subunit-like protein